MTSITVPKKSMWVNIEDPHIISTVKKHLTYKEANDDGSDIHLFHEKEDGSVDILYGLAEFIGEKAKVDVHHEARENLTNLGTNEIVDVYKNFERLDIENDEYRKFEVRPHQIAATRKCIMLKRGIVSIATGGGKTEVISSITFLTGDDNILILNNNKKIIKQIKKRCIRRGVDKEDVGIYKRGCSDKRIIIATTQTIFNGIKNEDPEILQILDRTNCLMFDEGHHLVSDSWMRAALYINPEYILTFTGSAFKDKKNPYGNPRDALLIGLTGGIIHKTTASWLISKGWLAEPHLYYLHYDAPPEKFL